MQQEKLFFYNALVKANPEYAAAGAGVGLTLVVGLSAFFSRCRSNPDLKTINRIAKEIFDLKPTICDASDYNFLKTHKTFIDSEKCRRASLSYQRAFLQSQGNADKKILTPDAILKLGQDLLDSRSGMCDHMAAAVIVKIVDHISRGGKWNSEVELVGTRGHAYVILNRNGSLDDPSTWGRQAVAVDTWLGCCGIHENSKHELTEGYFGVQSRPADTSQHAEFFEPEIVTHRFTVAELQELAHQRKTAIQAAAPAEHKTCHTQHHQSDAVQFGVMGTDLQAHLQRRKQSIEASPRIASFDSE